MIAVTRRKWMQAAAGASAFAGLLTQIRDQAQGPATQRTAGNAPANPAIPDTKWHNYAGDLGSTRYRRGTADAGGGGFGGDRGVVNDAMDPPIEPGLVSIAGLPLNKPPYGRITALNLSNGTLKWQVPHGETPDGIRNHPLLKGVPFPAPGNREFSECLRPGLW